MVENDFLYLPPSVRTLAGLSGNLTLVAGSNMSITPADQTITFDVASSPSFTDLLTLTANNLGQALVNNKGILIQNTTPATGNGPTLQQSSPPLIFAGHSWQSNAPAGDKVTAFRLSSFSNVPAGGIPSSTLKFDHTVGPNLTGTWTTAMQIDFDQIRFFSTAFFSAFSASGSGVFSGACIFTNSVIYGSAVTFQSLGSAAFTGATSFTSFTAGSASFSSSVSCQSLTASATVEADRIKADTDVRAGTNNSFATYHGKTNPSAVVPVPGNELVAVQTPSLPGPVSGDAFLFVAPITTGTIGGSASEVPGIGIYIENGSTYDLTAVNYYNDGTTTWYSPAQAVGSFTDGNAAQLFSISFSWNQTGSGGGYTGTLLGRQINGGGYQWFDAGGIGASGSISDDGTGIPYNWGSSSAPGTASPDFVASGQTYTFDCYADLLSPSGHPYFILGDSPSQVDPNDGNPYQLELDNINSDTVKFVQTSPAAGNAYDVPTGNRVINTATASDSTTTTPNDYRYAADPMATQVYYRVTGYNTVSGHQYFGSSGSWVSGAADPSNPWIVEFTYDPVTPVLGYIVEFSTDGVTASQYIDFGNAVAFFDDALAVWTPGAPTLTPTSYTRPVFYFDADVLSGDPSGVCKIGSPGGSFKVNNLDSSDNVVSSQSFDEAGNVTFDAALTVTKDIHPAHLSDSAATNDSIYFSNDQSKLVYKDSGGTVHALY